MITFNPHPILVTTPLGDGYVIYVKPNMMFDNDEWCIAMVDGGQIRHFLSHQVQVYRNGSYEISKKEGK